MWCFHKDLTDLALREIIYDKNVVCKDAKWNHPEAYKEHKSTHIRLLNDKNIEKCLKMTSRHWVIIFVLLPPLLFVFLLSAVGYVLPLIVWAFVDEWYAWTMQSVEPTISVHVLLDHGKWKWWNEKYIPKVPSVITTKAIRGLNKFLSGVRPVKRVSAARMLTW